MKTYYVDCKKEMDEEGIRKCAEMIREGKIGIFPTETVYGIGTDARNSTAAQKIFEVKGRKSDNPFIVHISDFGTKTY